MLDRYRALLVAVVAAAALSGCSDTSPVRASYPNLEKRGLVYAMNGSSISLPAAMAVRGAAAVGVDASFAFDLAFDLDASGTVLVYTQAHVATQLVAAHRVGLLITDAAFDQVTRAPGGGFVFDSLAALPIGKTLLVDVLEGSCGASFLGPNIYAKIAIDSVGLATRSIYLHVLSNPNCGFRSLVPGTPKD